MANQTTLQRAPIFAAVRTLLKRGITDAEVRVLDRSIDEALGHIIVTAAKAGLRASAACIALLHEFEDCRLEAYLCPAKVWTIGWGSTTDENGKPIQRGAKWTQERCDARFRQDLARFEAGVIALLDGAPTNQGQFDALVSFAYNAGLDNDGDGKAEGLGDSTLLRKHKAGDYVGAASEFGKWNKGGGRVLAGLVRRRAAEVALYRAGK